jgi:hypothetical protein
MDVGIMKLAFLISAALPLAFGLAACEGAESAPGEPATPPGAAPVPVATECVDGSWDADLDNLLGQMARQFSAGGLRIASANATGSQTLVVGREGVLGFKAGMRFVMEIDMGKGVSMQVTQVHDGSLAADWQWADTTADGGTMTFSRFNDTGYSVVNTVSMGGQSTTMPITSPSAAAAGNVPMEVTCSGNTLTTHPRGTPFTTRWTRTGGS